MESIITDIFKQYYSAHSLYTKCLQYKYLIVIFIKLNEGDVELPIFRKNMVGNDTSGTEVEKFPVTHVRC